MEGLEKNPMSKEDIELILQRIGKYIEQREDIDNYRERPRELLDMALQESGEEIFAGIDIAEEKQDRFENRISIQFFDEQ